MTSKKIISIAMILCVILSLVACAGQGATTGDTGSQGESTQSGTEEGAAPNDDIYTVQVMVDAASKIKNSNETGVGKYIEENFGINFEYIPYSGDSREKQNLMLAGGDYNEIQSLQREDMVINYIKADALIELDPYLASMPDFTKRFADKIPYWRLPGEGKLYKWENNVPNNIMEHCDISVRSDLLENNGWQTPVSMDDWVAFLKKAKEENPVTVDGLPTVGITAPFAESWGLAGVLPAMYEKGDSYSPASNEGFTYNLKTKQFEDYFMNPYVKESFEFFNTLYRAGLLDEECFTDTSDKTAEKLQQGRALAVFYVNWENMKANAILNAAGRENENYVVMPIQSNVQVAEGQKRQIRVETTRPFDSWAITKNAKHPEKLLELINWGSSEEGQLILRNGFEGTHYTRDENGKRVPTQLMLDMKQDFDLWVKELGERCFPFMPAFNIQAEDGQFFDVTLEPEIKDRATLTPRQIEVYDKLGWGNSEQWYLDNSYFAETELSASVYIDPTSDLGKVHQKMTEVRVKHSAKMVLAETPEEFEAAYNEAMAEYDKLDHQAVIDEFNRLLQVQMESVEQYRSM